jgi:hypothetical protein
MGSGNKNIILICLFLSCSSIVPAQKRPGYFGGKILIGIEESFAPFATSEAYKMKSRGFGRIRLEKQIGRHILFGVNWQKQTFTVKDKIAYTVTSNAYGCGFRFFGRKRSIAPVGNSFAINVIYTSNIKKLPGNNNFGDISTQFEFGRSIPFVFPKLLLHLSMSTRIKVYDTETTELYTQYLSGDKSKYAFNEYIWQRNALKFNFGLIYAL